MAQETNHIQTGTSYPDHCFHLPFDKVEAYLRVAGVDIAEIQSFLSSCIDLSNPMQAMEEMTELQSLPHVREIREDELRPQVVGANYGMMCNSAQSLTVQPFRNAIQSKPI